ncbi:MAG TPA: fatty acid desaturase [Polyangiaceae bacterium]|jgi:fatty acid desaturase
MATLRFPADRRTVAWVFGLFPAVALVSYAAPHLAGWTVPLTLYTGFCAGTLAHNQNHCPTFVSKRMNAFYEAWLSVFYGFPTFAWIPTHNLNHHKFANRRGDATITWRVSKKNTWVVASTYFFVASYAQREAIDAFVRRAKRERPRLARTIAVQKATVACAHAALFALAVTLHGWALGALVYACSFGATAAMGLWGMAFINYVQHVDCDPWSAHDHSRSFVGSLGNWLVFNAGFHAAHHENPGLHWSKLPEAHGRIAHLVDPELCQRSLLAFCVRTYLLGAFDERFRTQQIGRAAYDAP